MFQPTPVEAKRNYEAVIIMHPDASEEEQKNLFKKNKSIIESFKGEFNHVDTWGKRRLTNPIDKHRKAIYFHSSFTADPTAIKELERVMKINDKVLRVVHTRLSEKQTIQKHMETYKEILTESIRREKERESKFQAKKAARARGRDGGPRDGGRDRDDRPKKKPAADKE